MIWPEGCVSKVVIVKNEWLTSTERRAAVCGKTTTRYNSLQDVHKPLALLLEKLLQRSGVRKVPNFRFAFSDRKDMGPSRAAWVRITASHVSTMGTYPV